MASSSGVRASSLHGSSSNQHQQSYHDKVSQPLRNSDALPIETLCQMVRSVEFVDVSGAVMPPSDCNEALISTNVDQNSAVLIDTEKTKLVEARLESLLPQSTFRELALRTGRSPKSAYLHLLAYGATNRCAGIEGLVSPLMIFDYLRPIMHLLYHGWQTTALGQYMPLLEIPSLGPLAESLFCGAIEKGDHSAVQTLLSCQHAKIDVNNLVITYEEEGLTAVELAAMLSHSALVRTLINYGADVNKSPKSHTRLRRYDPYTIYTPYTPEPKGALERMLLRNGRRASTEMVNLLLQAQARIDPGKLLVALCDGAIAACHLIITHIVKLRDARWLWSGPVHEAFCYFDEHDTCSLVRCLHECNMDLDVDADIRRHVTDSSLSKRFPPSPIDILIERGQDSAVALCYRSGASLTQNSITAAVRSQCSKTLSLVRNLKTSRPRLRRAPERPNFEHLRHEVSWSTPTGWSYSSHYRSSPFAEALVTGRNSLLHLFPVDPMNDHEVCAALAAAAQVGATSLCKSLSHLLPLDSRDIILGYALSRAIDNGQTETALDLLEAGASVDSPDGWGSPITLAMRKQNAMVVRALLDHTTANDSYRAHSLKYAVHWGDLTILQDLVTFGLPTGNSLAHAVRLQNWSCIRYLLRAGAVIDYQDKLCDDDCMNALIEAILHNNAQMLQLILDHGADITEDALVLAMRKAPMLVEVLLARVWAMYPRGRPGYGSKALEAAASDGRCDLVREMLMHGFQYRSADVCYSHGSPLTTAILRASGHDTDLVRIFLRHSAAPDDIILHVRRDPYTLAISTHNSTPLLVAISTGSIPMVRLLLDYGADPSLPATRAIAYTPLQAAADMGNKEIVHLLLSRGARIDLPPAARHGGTALQFACRGGFIGVAELLVAHGDDYLAAGSCVGGFTALEAAAENGRFDTVKWLMNLGDHPPKLYRSALERARENGHNAIVKLLESVVVPEDTNVQKAEDDALLFFDAVGVGEHLEIHQILYNDPRDGVNVQRGGITLLDEPSTEAGDDDETDLDEYQLYPKSRHYDGVIRDEEVMLGLEVDAEVSTGLLIANTSRDPLACRYCLKGLSNASALKRHEHTQHGGDRRHICDLCGKAYPRNDTLQRHLKTHNPSERHICATCGKDFGRRDTLRQHEKNCSDVEVMQID